MFGQIQPPLLVITPCFFLRIIHFKMEIWVCKEMLDFKFGDAKMFLIKFYKLDQNVSRKIFCSKTHLIRKFQNVLINRL